MLKFTKEIGDKLKKRGILQGGPDAIKFVLCRRLLVHGTKHRRQRPIVHDGSRDYLLHSRLLFSELLT